MPVLNELFIFQVTWYKSGVNIVEKLNFLWWNCMLDKQNNFLKIPPPLCFFCLVILNFPSPYIL